MYSKQKVKKSHKAELGSKHPKDTWMSIFSKKGIQMIVLQINLWGHMFIREQLKHSLFVLFYRNPIQLWKHAFTGYFPQEVSSLFY